MSAPAANGDPAVLFEVTSRNETGHNDSASAAARVPSDELDYNHKKIGSEDPDGTSKSVVNSGSDADNTVVRISRQSASAGPADAKIVNSKGVGEVNGTKSSKEVESTDDANEEVIKAPETNYLQDFLRLTQVEQLDNIKEHAKKDPSTCVAEEHERDEEKVEKHVISGEGYDVPIDADIVLVRDGSRIEVVIEPLPEDRHAEYQVCSHRDYVYRGDRRVHKRDYYETDYGDGGRSEVSFWLCSFLPMSPPVHSTFYCRGRIFSAHVMKCFCDRPILRTMLTVTVS